MTAPRIVQDGGPHELTKQDIRVAVISTGLWCSQWLGRRFVLGVPPLAGND